MHSPPWRVIIVNYRTGPLAVQAARSALRALGERGEVVVIDSHSGDDSLRLLKALPGVRTVALDQNRGFGAALNAGARDSEAGYMLCQNADVVCQPNLFQILEQRLEQLPRLAVVAPRLVGPGGLSQPSCRRFPTHASLVLASRGSPLSSWLPRSERRYLIPEPPSFTLCDVVAGACFAIRLSAWREVGGMDERFFLYAEDTDLCRRLKGSGWLVGYEPAAAVYHAWGASTGLLGREAVRRHADSLSIYLTKHHPDRPVANAVLWLLLRMRVWLARSC